MLLEILSLFLEDLLVDLEDRVGLLAKLKVLELKSGLDKHEHGHVRFKREPISGQIVPIDGLFKLSDLL